MQFWLQGRGNASFSISLLTRSFISVKQSIREQFVNAAIVVSLRTHQRYHIDLNWSASAGVQ